MTKPLFILWISLQFSLIARGQTNPAVASPFSIPSPQFRPAAPQPALSTPKPKPTSAELEAAAISLARAKDLEVLEKFERALVPIPPSIESRSGFDRVTAEIFEPEVFYIGHVAMGSSLATAIQRRNPLCLLNPYVFWASW